MDSSVRADAIRRWAIASFSGRALAGGAILKLLAFGLRLAGTTSAAVEVIDTIGDITLVVGAAALGVRIFRDVKRVVLWRVRRKLTLSYIFIGFIPAALIITFFLLAGLLLFFNVSAYSLRTRVDSLVENVQYLAQSGAIEVAAAESPADETRALGRRYEVARRRYAGVVYAVARTVRPCTDEPSVPATRELVPATAGAWTHTAAPTVVPEWVPCPDAARLVTITTGDLTQVVVRGVARVPGVRDTAVVVDVPFDTAITSRLGEEAGVTVGTMSTASVLGPAEDPDVSDSRPIRIGSASVTFDDIATPAATAPEAGDANRARASVSISTSGFSLEWLAFLESMDWETGRESPLLVSFRLSPATVYRRISGGTFTRLENVTPGQILLVAVAFVGCLFLVIQIVAFGMGFVLARSITGAVHELFIGTSRVGQGDFSYKIPIHSRDQLGELAVSFNSMTNSIEYLLKEKAEKERLEQELRIARSIQMSLLPQEAPRFPGLALTAHCEPAREVGGDYYDYLPIDTHRIGVLIADVSGKGTSAALYMAELKGVVLSLSQRHTSPRELLIEANRIIARHLDTRSFITITYAIIDLQQGTLTYARAGHCPLIHVPGPYAGPRQARILTPDGMVLGLQIDDGQMFERALEESTVVLGPGDLILLYTDGLTEAMNAEGDCFGEARLGAIVADNAHLQGERLREQILDAIQAFAGAAAQQDDMTMLLLRFDGSPARIA